MTAAAIILTIAIGLITSFVGSFFCFVLWVHFDLETKWEMWRYHKHADGLRRDEERDDDDPPPMGPTDYGYP